MISARSERKPARLPFFFIVLLHGVLSLCSIPVLPAAAEQFPLYPCIKTNVVFWERVYGHYSTRQGIVHDIDDLSRVYTVIDLVDWQSPDSSRINGERIQQAKERINAILHGLGAGTPPRTTEERRIASLFRPQRPANFQSAQDNIRVQLGQSDRFHEGVIRSGRYLAQFKHIFASQGLPPQLAYLPHVESSFNPKAHSKAGAAGLWQFTRSTGKEYLTINDQVDERYDPYLATHAAARLLKDNFEKLQSWPLALTAYNHGRAGMLRAVREMGSYENIFQSYNQGSFKFASRNFYSEFLAALRVATRLGSNPKFPFDQPEATVTVQLKQDMPIGRLRSAYRVSSEHFSRLNPALRTPVLEGDHPVPQGYLVRLPTNIQGKARLVR